MALKRIKNDLNEMMMNPMHYYSAGPIEDDLFKWQAVIFGPENSVYHGGIFKLLLQFPDCYPFLPPKIRFITPIYHPNIDTNGSIFLDILGKNWKPGTSILRIFSSIYSLLCKPNPKIPLNSQCAEEYQNNRELFDKNARHWTRLYAH